MILADTSIWIDHLRSTNRSFARLIPAKQLFIHPWITGELACGNLPRRDAFLRSLQTLPQAVVLRDAEILTFIERYQLWGKGVQLIDVHLLASAALGNLRLWTRDRRLAELADRMGMQAKTGEDGFVR